MASATVSSISSFVVDVSWMLRRFYRSYMLVICTVLRTFFSVMKLTSTRVIWPYKKKIGYFVSHHRASVTAKLTIAFVIGCFLPQPTTCLFINYDVRQDIVFCKETLSFLKIGFVKEVWHVDPRYKQYKFGSDRLE